jgi:thiamine pyrophosphate-dependent acetolactate synthase large subunit-like protein
VGLASAHGLACTDVALPSEVASTIAKALADGGPQVVLVRTDRQRNVEVHRACNAAVAAAVAALG